MSAILSTSRKRRITGEALVCTAFLLVVLVASRAADDPPSGFASLFNGKDFTGGRR